LVKNLNPQLTAAGAVEAVEVTKTILHIHTKTEIEISFIFANKFFSFPFLEEFKNFLLLHKNDFNLQCI
jgi:hypothetical protein